MRNDAYTSLPPAISGTSWIGKDAILAWEAHKKKQQVMTRGSQFDPRPSRPFADIDLNQLIQPIDEPFQHLEGPIHRLWLGHIDPGKFESIEWVE
ncbi:MAG: hypothetical protein Fur005_35430 [Roseiflexaceae bacterium]